MSTKPLRFADYSRCPSVAFDMDGTLIDSSESILSSIRWALKEHSLTLDTPLTSSMIGPPLSSLLASLFPSISSLAVEEVSASFKSHYDSFGCLLASPYKGVCDMLADLKRQGVEIFIVTNKRMLPTLKILECLGWYSLFSGVVTLDLLENPFSSKAFALEYFLLNFKLEASRTPYVGDRLNDLLAAKLNSMPFVYAEWGYGFSDAFIFDRSFPVMKSPSAAALSSCLCLLED